MDADRRYFHSSLGILMVSAVAGGVGFAMLHWALLPSMRAAADMPTFLMGRGLAPFVFPLIFACAYSWFGCWLVDQRGLSTPWILLALIAGFCSTGLLLSWLSFEELPSTALGMFGPYFVVGAATGLIRFRIQS